MNVNGRFVRQWPGAVQAAVYLLLCCFLFCPSLYSVFSTEWTDENANYGILVLPVCFYLAWEKSDAWTKISAAPSWLGFIPFFIGISVYAVGSFRESAWLTALGAWPAAFGILLMHFGRRRFGALSFPILFSLAAIPLPDAAHAGLVEVMQAFAAQAASVMSRMMGIPVLQNGSMIDLGSETFWIAEACSGIRYLVPLVLLSVLLAYWYADAFWKRALIVLASFPAVLFSNAFRIALTFYFHETIGPETAAGFFHEFSGWVVFMGTFGFLGILVFLLKRDGTQNTEHRTQNTEGIQQGSGTLQRTEDRNRKTGAGCQTSDDGYGGQIISGYQQSTIQDPGSNIQHPGSFWRRVLLDPPQFLPAVLVLLAVWIFGQLGLF